MRIVGLLVLLFALVSVCGARDAGQSSSSPTARNSFNSDLISPSEIAGQDFVQPWPNDRADRDAICYTIQDFMVKRQGPHSDVTTPVGYATCVPASKYGVKVVGEPGKAPSR